jgi:hypothetical protein
MTGVTSTQIKGFNAGAAITKNRIVKHGAADGAAIQAAAATDAMFGVSYQLDTASGATVDVVTEGMAKVEYGGTVTRGDPLTSDASGKAVTAAPAAGVNNRIIGYAQVSGVSGDFGLTSIEPGGMQGA